MIWLTSIAIAFGDPQCERIGLRDILGVEAPAVLILGERHGTQPDLNRASNIVYRMAKHHQVTVALESVHSEYQGVLDDYAEGNMDPSDLPHLMDWEKSWGFPWAPYEQLVTSAVFGAKTVAIGFELGPRPAHQSVPLPSNYIDILRDAMAGHDMPLEMESDLVQAMAWRDYHMAELAVQGWDGQGYLVIVVGRGHVEGSKGIAWQVQRMVQTPVHAFVLAWAENPPCYVGDKVWRPSFLSELF